MYVIYHSTSLLIALVHFWSKVSQKFWSDKHLASNMSKFHKMSCLIAYLLEVYWLYMLLLRLFIPINDLEIIQPWACFLPCWICLYSLVQQCNYGDVCRELLYNIISSCPYFIFTLMLPIPSYVNFILLANLMVFLTDLSSFTNKYLFPIM